MTDDAAESAPSALLPSRRKSEKSIPGPFPKSASPAGSDRHELERSVLPSALRGMPGVLYFNHCAPADAASVRIAIAVDESFSPNSWPSIGTARDEIRSGRSLHSSEPGVQKRPEGMTRAAGLLLAGRGKGLARGQGAVYDGLEG